MRIIDYKQTVDDVIAFNMYSVEQSGALEKSIRNTFLWYVILLTQTALIIFLLTHSMVVLALEILAGIFLLPLLISYFKRRIRSLALQQYRSALEKRQLGTIGKHQISLQDNCIENENDIAKRSWKYKAVENIIETAEHIFIKLDLTRAFIIPKRSTSPELLAEFLQELRSRIDAAKKKTAMSEPVSK